MALGIQPFRFDYQSGRVAPVQNITAPTWGPPDVSQMMMQGIASLAPTLAKAYQGVNQDAWKQKGIEAAGKVDLGSQALALGQPGGPYAQTPASPTTAAPAGKMPSFAKMEGGTPSADIGNLISSTAATHGLAPDFLTKLVSIETGGTFDPQSFNKGSKASGLTQFIPSTWRQYGGGASPFDPSTNLDAAARLTHDNANVLRKALGREPTQGELYLAHQQGAGGAAKLLANPDARAFDVVPPKHVMSNLPGSMRANARNMTAGQFASLWTSRFGEPAPAFAAGAAPQAAAAPAAVVPPPQAPNAGAPTMQLPPAAQGGPQPPNAAFASLGGQPTAPGAAPAAPPTPEPARSGPPLFPPAMATGAPAMTLPPEAQAGPAAPIAAMPPAPTQPSPAAVATAQAASPAVAANPSAPAAVPAAPPPAPPPAAPQGQSPQQAEQLRTILQAAIGSGDPALVGLAETLLKRSQPSYGFTEVGGGLYRTDPRAGTAERVVAPAAAPGFAILAPGDPRRPPGFANDPRPLQVDLKTGKIDPVDGPKEGGVGNNDQLLRPGDPARAALNIPDDGQTWRVRGGAGGKREIEPIRNPDVRESPSFTQEKALRGEFDEKIKDYRALRQTYDNMVQATIEPSASGDIAMVFDFMKMLDPTSVVRESEYATAANAGGVAESIRSQYNKLLDGEFLTPEKRENFVNRAGRRVEVSHKRAKADEQRFRELAGKSKLDADSVAKIDDWKFAPVKAPRDKEPRQDIEKPAVGAPGRTRANPVDIDGLSQKEIDKLPDGSFVRKGGKLYKLGE